MLSGSDWRAGWAQLTPRERRSVEQALESGRAIRDPAQAALVSGLGKRIRRELIAAALVAPPLVPMVAGWRLREGEQANRDFLSEVRRGDYQPPPVDRWETG